MIDWTQADRWHGLLMSAPMVRRALTGEKTETRRIGEKWKRAKPGEGIWLREAHAIAGDCGVIPPPAQRMIYRADYPACVHWTLQNIPQLKDVWWTPGILMPRYFCRLAFILTDVRQERIGDIVDEAIAREGVASLEARELLEMGLKRRNLPLIEEAWPLMIPRQKWMAGWEALHGAWDPEIEVTVLSWAPKEMR